jgi:hypothetical protein
MYHGRSRRGPQVQKRCWCGSGKKEKNCHGKAAPAKSVERLGEVTKSPGTTMKPWGVPGEEHKIVVAPVFKKEAMEAGLAGVAPKINLAGARGPYRVQFLLARPGYPITKEREFKFIDNLVGDSHIKIVKPEVERNMNDADRMRFDLLGKPYHFIGLANKDGFLAKFVADLEADSTHAAELEAYGSLAPLLSAWSLNLDIPLHIETIQVTDLTTHVSSLRVFTPYFEMNFGGEQLPLLQDEFCHYASIYREGLNTNSLFYRFLCFYKIIESLIAKRGRESAAKKMAGRDPRRPYEVIPETTEELLSLLNRLYKWRKLWDDMGVGQIFPPEVRGKKITTVRDNHFRQLRLGIAHALLQAGEITVILDKIEYIQQVNKWLPLCRICARWMLLNDFPAECSIAMK